MQINKFIRVKQRYPTTLNFEEKMRWNLRHKGPFQCYYVKSGTRIAEQASICVYKADTTLISFNDRSFL